MTPIMIYLCLCIINSTFGLTIWNSGGFIVLDMTGKPNITITHRSQLHYYWDKHEILKQTSMWPIISQPLLVENKRQCGFYVELGTEKGPVGAFTRPKQANIGCQI